MTTGLAALTDRDRDIMLLLGATVLCPFRLIKQALFRKAAARRLTERLTALSRAGLVEMTQGNATDLLISSSTIYTPTVAGWQYVADLGGVVPGEQTRRFALTIPAGVVAAAAAYAEVLGDGALPDGYGWELTPGTAEGGALPDGVWAGLRIGGNMLYLDIDRPGHMQTQVLARMKHWHEVTIGHNAVICYVVPRNSRRERILAWLGDRPRPWLTLDAPDLVVRAMQSSQP